MARQPMQEMESFAYAEAEDSAGLAEDCGKVAAVIFPEAGLVSGEDSREPARPAYADLVHFAYADEHGRIPAADAGGTGDLEFAGGEWFRQLLEAETGKAEERGRDEGVRLGIEQGVSQGIVQGIEAGRAQGREEAGRELRGERERLVAQAASLAESFERARESYLRELEREAATLALAIAARILRREAQMDPLLLTGAVRVALGQLAASTVVRVRVPAQDLPMWEETLRLMPGLAIRPEVVGDAQMELGECRMETELGMADLGLWPQLKAVEKGFFDRGERDAG